MTQQNPLIGKVVTAVYLADDGGAIRFDLEGGETLIVHAYGDCCSHSWIESIQGVEQLIGSPVVSVEDLPMPDLGSNRGTEAPLNRYGHDEEEMAYYGCKITTGKGYAVIDYRISSNGYYGGNLVWPGERFYGDVFGQNESEKHWQPVAP